LKRWGSARGATPGCPPVTLLPVSVVGLPVKDI
jgi:hypothetical protein